MGKRASLREAAEGSKETRKEVTAMSDHITRVREQAEKEAERRRANRKRHPENVSAESWSYGNYFGFIDGAAWLASRLTRENIAYVIHPVYGKRFHPEICEGCEVALEKADAVLALIGGRR